MNVLESNLEIKASHGPFNLFAEVALNINNNGQMEFGIPMIWREPKNHIGACYFYSVRVTGVHKKKEKLLTRTRY